MPNEKIKGFRAFLNFYVMLNQANINVFLSLSLQYRAASYDSLDNDTDPSPYSSL